jgi:MoxR-like ATPase
MANWPQYQYRGDGKAPTHPTKDAHSTPEPYRPSSKELVDAVNLSIFLGRPLLLEGEAGCGKSRLAYAVAYELGLPLKVWPVRSNSKAEDGLYRFDAIRRLYDAQAVRQGAAVEPKHDPAVLSNYLALGPLGEAIAQPDYPAVVLIDEIDKADIDFPNDLLNIIEDGWYINRETGEKVEAQHKPILFITSNREKGNLPLPFLRRCVYHFMRFPTDEKELLEIVARHYPDVEGRKIETKLAQAAIQRFLTLRKPTLHKKPGTSELLDWMAALHFFGEKSFDPDKLKAEQPVPFPDLLFKLQADMPAAGM